jgi:hypothetical protein
MSVVKCPTCGKDLAPSTFGPLYVCAEGHSIPLDMAATQQLEDRPTPAPKYTPPPTDKV